MNYTVITHDYDRTPDGDVPKEYEFEADDDLEAVLGSLACGLYGQIEGMSEKEIKQAIAEYFDDNNEAAPTTVDEAVNSLPGKTAKDLLDILDDYGYSKDSVSAIINDKDDSKSWYKDSED